MVRQNLLLVEVVCGLMLVSCFLSIASAEPLPCEESSLRIMAQDSAGRVWAGSWRDINTLYRWETNGWRAVSFDPGIKGQVAGLWASPTGSVVCAWRGRAGTPLVLSEHTMAGGTIRGTSFNQPQLFPDSAGNVWITGTHPSICRAQRGKELETVFTLTADQFFCSAIGRGTGSRRSDCRQMPVQAMEDGLGRVWFWTPPPNGLAPSLMLRGVMIFNKGKFEHHPTLTGIPNAPLQALVKKDATHLWVVPSTEGMYETDPATFFPRRIAPLDSLYELDTRTLCARRIEGIPAGVFCGVDHVFTAHNDLHVVSRGPLQRTERGLYRGSPRLWRLHNNRWQEVISHLEEEERHRSRYEQQRPWVATAEGLWLAGGEGLWFVPHEGEPKRLDSRVGFPLDGVLYLFTLPDGRLLASEKTGAGGIVVAHPRQFLAPREQPKNVRVLKVKCSPLQDERGHIWTLLPDHKAALCEWNGERWIDHVLPSDLKTQADSLAMDSRQRVWLIAAPLGTSTTIFDPATRAWKSYTNCLAALQTEAARPTQVAEPAPFSSFNVASDNRLCLHWQYSAEYCYYDGKSWRTSIAFHIAPKFNPSYAGPIFFDRTGRLNVNFPDATMKLKESGTWPMFSFEQVALEKAPEDRLRVGVSKYTQPPPGNPVKSHSSAVQDRHGRYWIAGDRQLYKFSYGLWQSVFSPNQTHPFISNKHVIRVLVDGQGNVFLETEDSSYRERECVVLLAETPPPNTTLVVSQTPGGGYCLRFTSTARGKARFRWRVDDGPWSDLLTEPEARIAALPEGRHRIEAVAIDEQLAADPTPAVAEVESRLDPRVITELITLLADKTVARREEAVKTLCRSPSLALPALKTAREKADDDLRWWIDAAIQAVEETLRKTQKGRSTP